jgi:hypothetical protein
MVSSGRIIGPDEPPRATYVLGMEYADWKALHEGYNAQRTVMYRSDRMSFSTGAVYDISGGRATY